MAHPKRKHSKQRSRKRRTHDGIKMASLSDCPQCKKPILSHRVCPFCGFYKGKQVVSMEVKEEATEETKA